MACATRPHLATRHRRSPLRVDPVLTTERQPPPLPLRGRARAPSPLAFPCQLPAATAETAPGGSGLGGWITKEKRTCHSFLLISNSFRLGKSSEPWSLRADTDLRGPVIWRVMRPGSPGSSWVPVHEAIPAPTLPARNGARAPALRMATELPGLLAPMPRPVGARSGQDPGHRKSTGLGGTDAALRPGPEGSIRAGGGGQWRELWKSVGRCAGVNKVSAMGGG